ncbi:MAG: bifunctional phosphoribosylaminoimidazolecarboxamide formyltransferase/IMP cyclohydrolase [Patescibacteria group bacterium]
MTKHDRYALLSVSDKTGIVALARSLVQAGYRIISTGGTARLLIEDEIPVVPIEEITGNPECFDGRMKTISFQVEGGILYDRNNTRHSADATTFGLPNITIVVCNLYPFTKTIQRPTVTQSEAIEQIDVGGPTMIRAAAKNYKQVLPVVDPDDYLHVVSMVQKGEQSIEETRKQLAAKAFAHLSWYDSQIAQYLAGEGGGWRSVEGGAETSTEDVIVKTQYNTLAGSLQYIPRYGENPHQKAAWFSYPQTNSPMSRLEKISGRDLSLLNITDINAGLESVRMFQEPAGVVIKHNSPCGIALGNDIAEALTRAIEADPVSAFGGVIVVNKELDESAARVVAGFKEARRGNIDVIAMPACAEQAAPLLTGIRKTMGVYTFGSIPDKRYPSVNVKWVDGGFIIQESDDHCEEGFSGWHVVTKKQPTEKQISQMQIAWKFISRIKSNAIIVMDQELPMTRGIGAGQTSRVGAVKLSLELAGRYAKGAILASDSFFPFADSVEMAVAHGIGAIVQQGGSIRDRDSVAAADKAGIAMIFTGRRAFWH